MPGPPPRISIAAAPAQFITIDDGYADTRTLAYPILRRYGFPATIFLVSDRMGDVNLWATDKTLLGRPLLSWSDVYELQSGGMEFGVHTRTHPLLTETAPEIARDEVEGARRSSNAGSKFPFVSLPPLWRA